MSRTKIVVILLGLGLGALAVAGRPLMAERAMMDSARSVPPKARMEWLHDRGVEPPRASPTTGESGLVLRGKWGRGPAAEVTGKDTLVVLTLGSEVALLNFAKPDSPQVLSEIQFPSLTAQSYLEDSLLYTSSNADLEIWCIRNPVQPAKRGQLLGPMGDFWIRDTFLFYIRSDSFHVLSIASPANLYELGSCIESGSVTTGTGNTVVVTQNGGYAFVDVSNPASPHQVGSYPCGRTQYFSAAARGNLVCASYEEAGYPYPTRFITLDISNPSSPRLLAKLNDLGGFGIFLDGPLAFVSGGDQRTDDWLPFQILSIADSAHPALIDSLRTTNDFGWAVWEDAGLERVFVADRYDGLAVVDIRNLNNAVLDTWVLKTGSAVDVHVDGNNCYVAGQTDGFRVLDVSDPTQPVCLSGLDTSFTDASDYSITARDSFAFVGWRNPYLRTVSVTDPLHPQIVASCSVGNEPEAMALRDSLLYLAENYKFQIVNVARPRAPVVVGTCGLPDYSYGMEVRDTLAFIANSYGGLRIVNVARPATPEVVGAWTLPNGNGAVSVAIVDTFAYTATGTLYIVSVANPVSPYLIDSVVLPTFGWSLAASDSLLFVGSSAQVLGAIDDIRVYDIADRVRPVPRGSLVAPDMVWRLVWAEPHLYAACYDAGVLVVETTAVGLQEPEGAIRLRRGLHVTPNPVADMVRIDIGKQPGAGSRLALYDATGRQVLVKQIGKEATSIELRLTGLNPGLYFVRVETRTGVLGSKLIKH